MELCEPTEMAFPLQGGGVAIYESSIVHFNSCTIRDNTATGVSRFANEPLRNSPSPQWSLVKPLISSSRLQGGGMYIYGSSTVTVITCTIRDNTATYVRRFPNS